MIAKNVSSDRKRSRPVEKQSKFTKIKKNKILTSVVLIFIIIVAISAVYTYMGNDSDNEGNPVAIIDTSMGIIEVELYEDKAPNTCENFIKLANDGFYSGLVFQRVANLDSSEPDTHVIQGGGFDEDGNYKESPYGTIDLEIHTDLVHDDGAIAMARTTNPNSATSQFYICDGAHHYLDDEYRQASYGERGYAVFGKVIDGMSVVRAIGSLNTITKTVPAPYNQLADWPLNGEDNVVINSITIQ